MKLLKILFVALAVISIGGFVYVASIDAPLHQQQIIKIIPNETIFNDK